MNQNVHGQDILGMMKERARRQVVSLLLGLSLVLLLPLGMISFYVLHDIRQQIATTKQERSSLQLFVALERCVNAVLAYRKEMLIHGSVSAKEIDEVNTRFAMADALLQREHIVRSEQDPWNRLHQQWSMLQPRPDLEHVDRFLSTFISATTWAMENSPLRNDSRRPTRILLAIDVDDLVPWTIDFQRLNMSMLNILALRPLNFQERVQIAINLTQAQTHERNMIDALELVSRTDEKLHAPAAQRAKMFRMIIDPYLALMERSILGQENEPRLQQLAMIKRRSAQVENTIIKFSKKSTKTLDDRLLGILLDQQQWQTIIISMLGLAWFIALVYCFISLRSMLMRLREHAIDIERVAAADVARREAEERQKVAEHELSLKTELWRSVYERAPVGIGTINAQGGLQEWNPKLGEFFQLPGEASLEPSINLINTHLPEYNDLLNTERDLLDYEMNFQSRKQDERWAHVILTRRNDSGVQSAICMVEDITDRKAAEKKLEYEATHDALTGLANRKLFRSNLRQVVRDVDMDTDGFAIAFIDLDLFKHVNDTYGHPAGDAVLVAVAERLRKILGPNDTIARFGGDEFAVLIAPPCSRERAEEIATRITMDIAEPIFWEDKSLHVGSSVGLAFGPKPNLEAEDIMRNADTAMYVAKTNGRGRYVVFDPTMLDATELAKDLLIALKDGTQIYVVYQPIVDLAKNRIVGFEAFPRWLHPKHGEIPPKEFMRLADESNASRELGKLVMRKSCAATLDFSREYPEFSDVAVHINVSAAELTDPTFVESVVSVLQETQCTPDRLCLEIMETHAVLNKEQVNSVLKRLREFGIRLALDDFGAKYASLRYLQDLAVDCLKIECAFLIQAEKSEMSETVVKAIIDLAVSLNISVCAVGVETLIQKQVIEGLGISFAQGNLWGEAMGIGELHALQISAGAPIPTPIFGEPKAQY